MNRPWISTWLRMRAVIDRRVAYRCRHITAERDRAIAQCRRLADLNERQRHSFEQQLDMTRAERDAILRAYDTLRSRKKGKAGKADQ